MKKKGWTGGGGCGIFTASRILRNLLTVIIMKKLFAFVFIGIVSWALVGATAQASEISFQPATTLAKKHHKHHKHKKHKK